MNSSSLNKILISSTPRSRIKSRRGLKQKIQGLCCPKGSIERKFSDAYIVEEKESINRGEFGCGHQIISLDTIDSYD